MNRGYFGIGIENNKTSHNLGTLWRSAHNLRAAFIFTIGTRYKAQSSDTTKAWRSIPLFRYDNFSHFYENTPHDCQLIGVEYPHVRSQSLVEFHHPERCIYLLGAEDNGLTKIAQEKCRHLIMIPGSQLEQSLNVAVAGSIIMYDRIAKSL